MKPLLLLLITALLSFLAGLWLPWWSVAPVAFLVALAGGQPPLGSFLTAFIAVFLLWFALAFFIDLHNDHILGTRMSELILGTQAPLLIAAASALLGGLTAGLAALSAAFLRQPKKKDRYNRYYR